MSSISPLTIPQVVLLDEFLNRRILDPAAPPAHSKRWWRLKVSLKQRLADLPDSEIAPVAARMLADLKQAV